MIFPPNSPLPPSLSPTQEYISDFADAFKHLSTIEIKFVPEICSLEENGIFEVRKAQYVKDAQAVLKGGTYEGEKLIILKYTHWEGPEYEEKVIRVFRRETIVVG